MIRDLCALTVLTALVAMVGLWEMGLTEIPQ